MNDATLRVLLGALAATPHAALRVAVIRALHAAGDRRAADHVDGLAASAMAAADRAFVARVQLEAGAPTRVLGFVDGGGEPDVLLARAPRAARARRSARHDPGVRCGGAREPLSSATPQILSGQVRASDTPGQQLPDRAPKLPGPEIPGDPRSGDPRSGDPTMQVHWPAVAELRTRVVHLHEGRDRDHADNTRMGVIIVDKVPRTPFEALFLATWPEPWCHQISRSPGVRWPAGARTQDSGDLRRSR